MPCIALKVTSKIIYFIIDYSNVWRSPFSLSKEIYNVNNYSDSIHILLIIPSYRSDSERILLLHAGGEKFEIGFKG